VALRPSTSSAIGPAFVQHQEINRPVEDTYLKTRPERPVRNSWKFSFKPKVPVSRPGRPTKSCITPVPTGRDTFGTSTKLRHPYAVRQNCVMYQYRRSLEDRKNMTPCVSCHIPSSPAYSDVHVSPISNTTCPLKFTIERGSLLTVLTALLTKCLCKTRYEVCFTLSLAL
jgi:hypothetical protein